MKLAWKKLLTEKMDDFKWHTVQGQEAIKQKIKDATQDHDTV